jgi:CheW-like domain
MNPVSVSAAIIDDRSEERQQQRFILAKLDRYTYVFPSTAVLEILLLDRGKILSLPHYGVALLGVIEHKSQVVPLVAMRQIIGISNNSIGETLTIVRLNHYSERLGGVGLVFDKTLGSCFAKDLPSELLGELQGIDLTSTTEDADPDYRLFKPELIDDRLWQPLRWN